ncbi:MAG: hypothetical protein ACK534_05270 [Phenylobacterium sp.]|jgi:hypothetical protein|uniref:hypothetical protein n=1 Tax=Phenylobacterium sp. TaxID=1871053 RepID=UPI00391FABE8
MAKMPKGQPREVPDPEGELYDREMARIRRMQETQDYGAAPPQDLVEADPDILDSLPRIRQPGPVASLIPVVGPAWQAAADLQEGNLVGAGVNTALAIADATPAGPLIKGAKAAKLGIGVLKKGSVTAGAAQKMIKKAGLTGPGKEVHHSIPLDGVGRSVQDWRNHYLFLKVLPKEVHRRLHGSWAGKPRYDPVRRIWYGTTDWQKAFPTSGVSMTADSVENSSRNSTAKSK